MSKKVESKLLFCCHALLGVMLLTSFQACTSEKSETKGSQFEMTNRNPGAASGYEDMGTNHRTQCQSDGGMPFDGADSISGKPIAGVDNHTFGSDTNGVADSSTTCGKCATISGAGSGSAEVIIADRIHQNAGDADGNGQGGHNQIDVTGTLYRDGQPFEELLGKNNPQVNVEIGPCS